MTQQPMTCEQYLSRLNLKFTPQQQAAIASVEDPTLLLAVPGSGKTTVLVARLGYLIHGCGIAPEQILTVTYTVAATRDLRQRFAAAFGEELAGRMEFRTINGICARILYTFERRTGKKLFTLAADEKPKLMLLSGIYQKHTGEFPADSDLKAVSTAITYIKNRMLKEEEISAMGEEQELPLPEIYHDYTRTMRERGQMDYDDQMVYALNLLRRFPWLLEQYQGMYSYICVDEAQDTSKIQHEIISVLAGKTEHLFMVGDEDQSIYGFRAAYPEALLNFEKDHPRARVLLMEENFRSNARIVEAADRFIQKNQLRHRKNMKAVRGEGSEVRQIDLKHRNAQYTWLVKMAQSCQTETAILYRDNESILPVVDRLEREGIPYRIRRDDLSFFSHRLVQDIRHIISFAMEPTDPDLFMKIYYKIGTYLSKNAALQACMDSERRGLPILDAAMRYGSLGKGAKFSLPELKHHLREILHMSASDALYCITREMGYGAYMERVHISENKLQILRALAAGEPTPMRLLERLDELSDCIATREQDVSCPLILSTIHSSKGLEYDTVYLLDIHDGIFPEEVVDRKRASREEIADYEEERRIFYVGATRAKNQLNILTVNNGSTFCRELLGGKTEPVRRSTKGRGIGGAAGSGKGSRSGSKPAGSGRTVSRNAYAESLTRRKKESIRTVTESEYYEKLEEIRSSGRVRHKVLGEGRLLDVKGDTLTIEFEDRTIRCMLRYMMEHELV